jgi:hypothetical protein
MPSATRPIKCPAPDGPCEGGPSGRRFKGRLTKPEVSAIAAGAAGAEVVNNNIPGPPLPANVPSVGFEATQTSQFGGQVELAGTARKGGPVTVGMSSWGCQSGSWTGTPECVTAMGAKFAWPVTLNVYQVGAANSVGALVTSVTKTFNMPYRPSQNNHCYTGTCTGAYYSASAKECFHSKLFKITFPLGKITLPSKVIIGVAYNTSDYGAEPQRPKSPACETGSGGCPFDSLNVGVREATEPGPSVGSASDPADAYINSTTVGNYCANPLGVGTFALSAGCWTGEQPTFAVSSH